MTTLEHREGVPAATRFEVPRVLRNALNRARREELLSRNVAEPVNMPKVSKGEGKGEGEGKPWSAPARSHRAHTLWMRISEKRRHCSPTFWKIRHRLISAGDAKGPQP
ncbi:hypothetical protein OG883_32030 [Streptomyces sp. NBC_01142]|uniref:hypothetical protein n=1 Tax=Streptomyces sp. NBC_01142 TaxID=2975865 RepID=UPI002259A0C9|nr:hypothetical protein [Streptomyces sp. NBC_01142]MCX4824405.1 hypothetical protein [Streptomyces sp. NBC_01142]